MSQKFYFFINLRKLSAFISKTNFRMYSIVMFLFATPLTYIVLKFANANNLFELLNEFPSEIKELLSLNSWWLDTMLGMCIPLCLSLALSIQLARLRPEYAETVKIALPWIFPLKKIFFSKISVFFVFTSAVFFGAVMFLTFGPVENNYKSLGLLFFPFVILYLVLEIRKILSVDPMKSKFGQFLLKKQWLFTSMFIALAGFIWVYCELWVPFSTRWDLFVFFKSYSIN